MLDSRTKQPLHQKELHRAHTWSYTFTMVSAAQFKAMKNNKRKREVQDNEPDYEEYEPVDQNDTSSSEEESEESDEESILDDDDDEDASAFAGHGSLVKGKGRATGGENSFLDDEEPRPATKQATFKQKTLVLSSRGITHRMRHMMKDIANLLPHSKTGG